MAEKRCTGNDMGGPMKRKSGYSKVKMAALLFVAALVSAAAWGDPPLVEAARRGDTDAVISLLDRGADVNAAQGDGMTALHWAAKRGSLEMAEVLLSSGARVDEVTRIGQHSPLHLASSGGHAPVVRRLLEAGADANAGTATGATALHFAAGSGSAESVDALVAHGATVDAREAAWEQTPLMWAAAYNRRDAASALLAGGADFSLTSGVEDLIERGKKDREERERRQERLEAQGVTFAIDPQDTRRKQLEEEEREKAKQQNAQAALDDEKAETTENEEAAEYEAVEEEEKKPLSYDELIGAKGGLTPLHFAVRQGNWDLALALLEAGADINRATVGDHTSPLLMATLNGHFDVAIELLERGADPMIASGAGATPLYGAIHRQWAAEASYPQPRAHLQQQTTYLELMEALLRAGADPDVRLLKTLWYEEYNFKRLFVETPGATTFWRAAWATDVPAMRLLISYGADPHIPTAKPFDGPTPLDIVGGYGNVDSSDQSGLEPVPVGGPGIYPIHAAAGIGHSTGFGFAHQHAPGGWLPAIEFLVEEVGVDPNSRDYQGFNAVHHAAARGDVEVIRYLVEQGADVTAVSRRGQTTADMANGPVQRVPPYPEALRLLESLGAKNNHNCVSC